MKFLLTQNEHMVSVGSEVPFLDTFTQKLDVHSNWMCRVHRMLDFKVLSKIKILERKLAKTCEVIQRGR